MEKPEPLIWQYIEGNWVVSFTTQQGKSLWSANAFYIVDIETVSLIILSNMATEHSKMLLQNPIVSGTISNQEKDVVQLKGLQFLGEMKPLKGFLAEQAFQNYCERFPIAQKMKETVWQLRFTRLKYTDNSLGFGTKLCWDASKT